MYPFDRIKAVLNSGLPKTERFVMVAFARYANKNGVAWPALSTVADDTGLTRRAVRKAVASLKGQGLLVPCGSGPRGSTRYIVHNPEPRSHRNHVPTPGNHVPRGDRNHVPDPPEPRSSEEPIEEPIEEEPPSVPPVGGRLVELLRGALVAAQASDASTDWVGQASTAEDDSPLVQTALEFLPGLGWTGTKRKRDIAQALRQAAEEVA